MELAVAAASTLGVIGHTLTVRPVSMREHDQTLGCERVRGVGFRPSCSCGWRGSCKGTVQAARAQGDWHRFGNEPAADTE